MRKYHNRRLLVIEQDKSLSLLLSRMLWDMCGVDVTRSISHAHAYFEEKRPDAILIDFDIVREEGLHDLKTLGCAEAEIPIIMLGDPENEEQRLCAMDVGIVTFLSKPFSVSEARLVVGSCIDLMSKYSVP